MEPEEARRLLEHARRWAAKGWIPGPSLARIEAELRPEMAKAPTARRAALPTILHGLGGILLGAAAIALVVLLFDNVPGDHSAQQAAILFGIGLVALAGGVALWLLTRNQDLADALLVASLVCLTFAPVPDDGLLKWACLGSMAVAAALSFLRRTAMGAFFATAAFHASAFVMAFKLFQGPGFFSGPTDAGYTVWLLLAVTHTVALLSVRVGLRRAWLSPALSLAAPALAGPSGAFADQVLDLRFDGAVELVVALPAVALLAAALRFREPGLLLGASAVLSLDAIAFAFDVGGLAVGIVVLLAVAAAVLGLATVLRKRWAA